MSRVLALVLALSAAVTGAPVPKATDEQRLKQLFGSAVDPDKDCRFTLDGSKLSIRVPGTPHTLASGHGRSNAPRVVRTVKGDFAAQVRVQIILPTEPKPVDGVELTVFRAGLIVWGDDRDFAVFAQDLLTVNRAATRGGSPNGFREVWKDGQYQSSGKVLGGPCSERTAFYRIVRTGDRLHYSASVDGTHWHELSELRTTLPAGVEVGVYAGQSGQTAFSAEFADFIVMPAQSGK